MVGLLVAMVCVDHDGTTNTERSGADVASTYRYFLAREDKVDDSEGVLALVVALEPDDSIAVLVGETKRTPLRGERDGLRLLVR